MRRNTEVLIVGAGPAGLAAAIALRQLGVGPVTVVDREPRPAASRACAHHTGFGLRDLHGSYSGPGYARHYVAPAERAGVTLRPATTITSWAGAHAAGLYQPGGLGEIEARAVVLATGCRERPRAARLVPGSRPGRACSPPARSSALCTSSTCPSAAAPSSSAPRSSACRRL